MLKMSRADHTLSDPLCKIMSIHVKMALLYRATSRANRTSSWPESPLRGSMSMTLRSRMCHSRWWMLEVSALRGDAGLNASTLSHLFCFSSHPPSTTRWVFCRQLFELGWYRSYVLLHVLIHILSTLMQRWRHLIDVTAKRFLDFQRL